jgi:hypothetical protein
MIMLTGTLIPPLSLHICTAGRLRDDTDSGPVCFGRAWLPDAHADADRDVSIDERGATYPGRGIGPGCRYPQGGGPAASSGTRHGSHPSGEP